MIAQKILNVMSKIGPVIKDKTNEEKGFDYASIANIIFKAREAMIEEKIIIIPLTVKQIVNRGNDVMIDMIYRLYDTEPGKDKVCDYMDVNIPGEGCDKEGWAIYKALSGAYKYLLTQTFAIPTIDDAEKDKYTTDDTIQSENIIDEDGELNENNIDSVLGNPNVDDLERIAFPSSSQIETNLETVMDNPNSKEFDNLFELGNVEN